MSPFCQGEGTAIADNVLNFKGCNHSFEYESVGYKMTLQSSEQISFAFDLDHEE